MSDNQQQELVRPKSQNQNQPPKQINAPFNGIISTIIKITFYLIFLGLMLFIFYIPVNISTNPKKNGLILIGSEEDTTQVNKFMNTHALVYDFSNWKFMSHENQMKLLQTFKLNSNSFRVVLLISQKKLQDSRAIYIRQIFGQLQYLTGIQDYLQYIDILVTQRTFSHDLHKTLKKFVKGNQNYSFKKTPHLIFNILFNLKNNSITQDVFFKEVVHKIGLDTSYLSIVNNKLDLKLQIRKQAQQYLQKIDNIIKQDRIKDQILVSLYYAIYNNQRNLMIKMLKILWDNKIVLHLNNQSIEKRYIQKCKRSIEKLERQIQHNGQCTPPDFNREDCQYSFYIKKINSSKAK